MEARTYRLSPAAVEDMEAIVDYLRERNPVAAVRFVEAAQATFEHLGIAAPAYPKLGWDEPKLADLRGRPLTGAFHRYVVFYRETDEFVHVVRVLHSARDIDEILSDEQWCLGPGPHCPLRTAPVVACSPPEPPRPAGVRP